MVILLSDSDKSSSDALQGRDAVTKRSLSSTIKRMATRPSGGLLFGSSASQQQQRADKDTENKAAMTDEQRNANREGDGDCDETRLSVTHLSILVLGSPHCGKTTMCQTLLKGFGSSHKSESTSKTASETQSLYLGPYIPTIEDSFTLQFILPTASPSRDGDDTSNQQHESSIQRVVVTLVDLGGHPLYTSLMPSAIAAADAFMLVYDVGDSQSLLSIWQFYRLVVETKKQPIDSTAFMLIGNMIDTVTTIDTSSSNAQLSTKRPRQVATAQAQSFADTLGIPYAETTSKAPQSIMYCFRSLVTDAQRRSVRYWNNSPELFEYASKFRSQHQSVSHLSSMSRQMCGSQIGAGGSSDAHNNATSNSQRSSQVSVGSNHSASRFSFATKLGFRGSVDRVKDAVDRIGDYKKSGQSKKSSVTSPLDQNAPSNYIFGSASSKIQQGSYSTSVPSNASSVFQRRSDGGLPPTGRLSEDAARATLQTEEQISKTNMVDLSLINQPASSVSKQPPGRVLNRSHSQDSVVPSTSSTAQTYSGNDIRSSVNSYSSANACGSSITGRISVDSRSSVTGAQPEGSNSVSNTGAFNIHNEGIRTPRIGSTRDMRDKAFQVWIHKQSKPDIQDDRLPYCRPDKPLPTFLQTTSVEASKSLSDCSSENTSCTAVTKSNLSMSGTSQSLSPETLESTKTTLHNSSAEAIVTRDATSSLDRQNPSTNHPHSRSISNQSTSFTNVSWIHSSKKEEPYNQSMTPPVPVRSFSLQADTSMSSNGSTSVIINSMGSASKQVGASEGEINENKKHQHPVVAKQAAINTRKLTEKLLDSLKPAMSPSEQHDAIGEPIRNEDVTVKDAIEGGEEDLRPRRKKAHLSIARKQIQDLMDQLEMFDFEQDAVECSDSSSQVEKLNDFLKSLDLSHKVFTVNCLM